MSEKLQVAAVQHNYVVPGHQDTPISKTARFEALTKLTLETKQDDADLIVWPELGLGFDPQALNTDEFITLAQKVRHIFYRIWIGRSAWLEEKRSYNA